MAETLRISADRRGFTLIEIIITITISAVLAIILAQVVANQTCRSYEPIQTIDENLALRAVMESITSDYRHLLRNNPLPLNTLQERVAAGFYWNGRSYAVGLPIQAVHNHCVEFDESGSEGAVHETCTEMDRILKVSLAVASTPHRLTSLFAR